MSSIGALFGGLACRLIGATVMFPRRDFGIGGPG